MVSKLCSFQIRQYDNSRTGQGQYSSCIHDYFCYHCGGLYTPPGFPGGLRADSGRTPSDPTYPEFWIFGSGMAGIVQWLSGACLSDGLVRWTFPVDSPAGISPNQQGNPLESPTESSRKSNGQQWKVQWKVQRTALESPMEPNRQWADQLTYYYY